MKHIKRGEIWLADLGTGKGSEQNGYRPVIIIQNDIGNYYSPTTIIAVISGKLNKASIPTHVLIEASAGLERDSVAFLEQIRTIDKTRLEKKVMIAPPEIMAMVDKALRISVGL
jgi:mRNA interferase MazF